MKQTETQLCDMNAQVSNYLIQKMRFIDRGNSENFGTVCLGPVLSDDIEKVCEALKNTVKSSGVEHISLDVMSCETGKYKYILISGESVSAFLCDTDGLELEIDDIEALVDDICACDLPFTIKGFHALGEGMFFLSEEIFENKAGSSELTLSRREAFTLQKSIDFLRASSKQKFAA
jgi:hypothetical protein